MIVDSRSRSATAWKALAACASAAWLRLRQTKRFLLRYGVEGLSEQAVELFCHHIRWRPWRLLKRDTVPFLPATVDIEPINACNFACDHCQVTHWERETVRLSPQRLSAMLAQFRRLKYVKLQGMGEPLLNRRLVDMLEDCERRGIRATVVTNGSVYTDAIAKRLIGLRRAVILFSIDGATAETFEAIRVNGKFDAVVAHIGALVRQRGTRSWPRIEINTVATARNLHELPEIVRLAKRLGVNRLTISTTLTDWGDTTMHRTIAPIDVSRPSESVDDVLRNVDEVAAQQRLRVDVVHGQRYSPSNRCPWPWGSAYIAANGDVVPCCVVGNSKVAKMGNLHEQPMREIWNNARYRRLRRRIANDDVPDYCRTCYGLPPRSEASPIEVRSLTQ